MHDLKWIRENAQAFDAALARRGEEPRSAAILALDEERRATIETVQAWQERRNRLSKEIGLAKGQNDEERAAQLMEEVSRLKSDITSAGEKTVKRIETDLQRELSTIPNLPLDDVPDGADESANVEVRKWGEKRKFDFAPRQHFEIGEALGLMDFETAAKLSGSRFVVLRGALARLERAIACFMLDIHTGEFGYQETLPPALVRDEALFGTGQLPKFAEDLFVATQLMSPQLKEDHFKRLLSETSIGSPLHAEVRNYVAGLDLADQYDRRWLIPTAEVPLTNLVREEILDEAALPMRMTAWTPCFRAEAGAAGKDTRGMIRQHQFSKVELVSITTPEQSLEELERMTGCAETILQRLQLPYRTVVLCTGDMGFAARKTYDIEVWLPGQNTYREISSCSVCGDFQARRMNARYRSAENQKEISFVHTLNGSGLAVGRTMIAILENFQNADGSVTVPPALVPYMGGLERIEVS